jgi:carotenoid cleavage dioxygenase-like enzyme
MGPLKGVDSLVAYYSITPEGVLSQPFPVDPQAKQMMHDFAVSRKYAVFLDQALVFDGPTMVKEKTIPFVTDLSRPSRLGLLQRAAPHKGVHWIPVDPFVCFHTANAWDDGDKVHVVFCRCASPAGSLAPMRTPPLRFGASHMHASVRSRGRVRMHACAACCRENAAYTRRHALMRVLRSQL